MPMVRVSNGGTDIPSGYIYGVNRDGALVYGYETVSYIVPYCCNAKVYCKGYNTLTGNFGVASGVNKDGTTTQLGNLGQVGSVDVSNYDMVLIWGQVDIQTVTYSLS